MRFLIIIFLLLTLSPAHAQEPLPTPLNAADVFTDAVEVVETLPLVTTYATEMSLYDFEMGAWRTFTYPAQSPLGAWLTARGDGTYVLQFTGVDGYLSTTLGGVWNFDLATGEFTQPETVCGEWVRLPTHEEQWMLYWDAGSHYHLCFTGTGGMTSTLPLDEGEYTLVGVSPDEQWAILKNDNYFVAYNFSSNEIVELGAIFPFDQLYLTWGEDTRIVLRTYTGNPHNFHALYTADLTQTQGLTGVYLNQNEPIFIENPPRYEWLGFAEYPLGFGKQITDENCIVHELSLATFEITDYHTPNVCELGILIPDGSDERLLFNAADSIMNRFNRYTGEIHALFESALGGNLQFSPEGRYLEMVVVTDLDAWQRVLTIHDLQTGELVYEVDYTAERDRTQWLDHERFLAYWDENVLVDMATGEQTLIDAVYKRGYPISPDGRYILLEIDDDTLGVYDVATGESRIIAQHFGGYHANAAWQADNTLHVYIANRDFVFAGNWIVSIVP